MLEGQLKTFFTVEYRHYFTKYHPSALTITGGLTIGATEACIIMYGLQFFYAMHANTTESTLDKFNIGKMVGLSDYEVTRGDLIAYSTSILSLQYNFGNFYEGYKAAKDKTHALLCMIPYL